jgi:hypothetical protein
VIRTPDQLAAFIRFRLTTSDTCRIFYHVLWDCWPRPEAEQIAAIHAFATEHSWEVKIHEPASYGIVADFRESWTSLPPAK